MRVPEEMTVVLAIAPGLVTAVGTLHTVFAIDPDEALNIARFDAFECTQVAPQSVWLKDVAPWNMRFMSVT